MSLRDTLTISDDVQNTNTCIKQHVAKLPWFSHHNVISEQRFWSETGLISRFMWVLWVTGVGQMPFPVTPSLTFFLTQLLSFSFLSLSLSLTLSLSLSLLHFFSLTFSVFLSLSSFAVLSYHLFFFLSLFCLSVWGIIACCGRPGWGESAKWKTGVTLESEQLFLSGQRLSTVMEATLSGCQTDGGSWELRVDERALSGCELNASPTTVEP